MEQLERWLGKTVLALSLFYFFGAVASALWLQQHLKSAEFARDPICWSRSAIHINGPDKYRHRPTMRDWLVIRTIYPGDGGSVPRLFWQLRSVALKHVYAIYWPEAERRRLFEAVASRMRPCGSPPAG